jgi:hypothetical protein
MLTYADVCWRMLTYADVCWRMLTYADVCFAEGAQSNRKLGHSCITHLTAESGWFFFGLTQVIAVNKTDVLSKAHIKTLIRSQTEALGSYIVSLHTSFHYTHTLFHYTRTFPPTPFISRAHGVFVNMYVCMHIRMCVCVCVCVCMCVCMCVCVCVCVCVYIINL